MAFKKGEKAWNAGKKKIKDADGKAKWVDREPQEKPAIPISEVEFPLETLFHYLKFWRESCKRVNIDCRHCRHVKFCGPAYDKIFEKIHGGPNVVSGKS